MSENYYALTFDWDYDGEYSQSTPDGFEIVGQCSYHSPRWQTSTPWVRWAALEVFSRDANTDKLPIAVSEQHRSGYTDEGDCQFYYTIITDEPEQIRDRKDAVESILTDGVEELGRFESESYSEADE